MLARLVVDDDLDALRNRFTRPDVAIGETITSMIDGQPTAVHLDCELLAVS